MKFAYKVV